MIKARILKAETLNDVREEIKKIGAYRRSVPLMSPKALTLVIKIKNVSSPAANIIKQEMLSLGADAAVSKEVISGSKKKTDCLLFGTLAQYKKLLGKLKKQPFGLKRVGDLVKNRLENYSKKSYKLKCRSHTLYPGRKTYVMGIINVTPDSFSDGGRYFTKEDALKRALELVKAGADIIDIGGESTRPGAKTVSAREQIKRTVPVIKALSKKTTTSISIDTRDHKVAEAAIKAGASIINDISGLRHDKKIAAVAARYKAGLIIMHSRGTPRTMQKNPVYKCLMQDIIDTLEAGIEKATDAGLGPEQIVIDPGLGFGKTTEGNLAILKRLSELKSLGLPILIGPSRKSYIGNTLKLPVDKRFYGTLASVVYAVLQGATIVRVHDVREAKEALKLIESIQKVKTQT